MAVVTRRLEVESLENRTLPSVTTPIPAPSLDAAEGRAMTQKLVANYELIQSGYLVLPGGLVARIEIYRVTFSERGSSSSNMDPTIMIPNLTVAPPRIPDFKDLPVPTAVTLQWPRILESRPATEVAPAQTVVTIRPSTDGMGSPLRPSSSGLGVGAPMLDLKNPAVRKAIDDLLRQLRDLHPEYPGWSEDVFRALFRAIQGLEQRVERVDDQPKEQPVSAPAAESENTEETNEEDLQIYFVADPPAPEPANPVLLAPVAEDAPAAVLDQAFVKENFASADSPPQQSEGEE